VPTDFAGEPEVAGAEVGEAHTTWVANYPNTLRARRPGVRCSALLGRNGSAIALGAAVEVLGTWAKFALEVAQFLVYRFIHDALHCVCFSGWQLSRWKAAPDQATH